MVKDNLLNILTGYLRVFYAINPAISICQNRWFLNFLGTESSYLTDSGDQSYRIHPYKHFYFNHFFSTRTQSGIGIKTGVKIGFSSFFTRLVDSKSQETKIVDTQNMNNF